MGHAWGGAARVAVLEEQGLTRVSVNLLRKRRLRPVSPTVSLPLDPIPNPSPKPNPNPNPSQVRDAAGLSQAVLEEVAVQVLGLGLGLGIGLGFGLDSRRWLCSFGGAEPIS